MTELLVTIASGSKVITFIHTPHAHTVLGWQVPDIDAAIDALAAKGVKMIIYPGFGQDEKCIWTSPDGKAKVSFFHDPDGNGLSLTQT